MFWNVGLKINTGGEISIIFFGLRAADIIQATGKKKRIEIPQAPKLANLIGPGLRLALKVKLFIYSSAFFLAFKIYK
jgi:hypothetical protein